MISEELKGLIIAVQKSLSALESKGVLMEVEIQDEKSENARLRNKIKLLESANSDLMKQIELDEFKLGRINRENEKEFQPIKLEDFGIFDQKLDGEFVEVGEISKDAAETNIIPDFETASKKCSHNWKGAEYNTYGECTSEVCIECGADRRFNQCYTIL